MAVDDSQRDGIRGRLGARGEEAISDIAQILVDNPLLNQALQAAFGARDLAQNATNTAIKGVGVGTSADVERLARRLRSISDRLEEVEDKIDDLADELSQVRKSQAQPQGEASDTVAVPVDQVRLGLSE
jgi:chromosome segregation ATPase